jgi:hypothetical protein
MSRPPDLSPECFHLIRDEDEAGMFWSWDVSQAWSDQLGDVRQDIYTLADGQPADTFL